MRKDVGQRVPRRLIGRVGREGQQQDAQGGEQEVDGWPRGGGDEVGTRLLRQIDGRQTAQRPHHDLRGVAVHPASRETVAELVQQHRHEEQTGQLDAVEPGALGVRGSLFKARRRINPRVTTKKSRWTRTVMPNTRPRGIDQKNGSRIAATRKFRHPHLVG